MGTLQAICLAFAAGLTASGLAGSVLEAATGSRLHFGAPFVSPHRIARSLLVTSAAGPFMLVNEALAARRQHAVSRFVFMSCVAVSAAWTLALGIVAIHLASLLGTPLG